MEATTAAPLRRDTVYVRTAMGQRELIAPSIGLGPWERRFLACVTGFTPLQLLLDLGLADPRAAAGIEKLLGAQLLAEVDPTSADARRMRQTMPLLGWRAMTSQRPQAQPWTC